MGKTMLQQIAVNQALYKASRGERRLAKVSAGQALLSAAMIERQKANADGYSYAGGSYGSFVKEKDPVSIALQSSVLLQEGSLFSEKAEKKIAAEYISGGRSYAAGSYGQFVKIKDASQADDPLRIAEVLDGGVGAGSGAEQERPTDAPAATKENSIKAFLVKYKLWIMAAVCIALYFVLRKK